MKKNRLLLMLLVLPLLPACGSPFYKIAPIDATVTDAQTGQPIEGVIVIANWQFKPGFEIQRFSNTYRNAGTETPGPIRESQLDGGVIKMVRAREVPPGEQHPVFYQGFDIDLQQVIDSDCDWQKIPRMLLASDGEIKSLLAKYPEARVRLPRIESIDGTDNSACGSAAAFFRNVKQ